MEEKTGDLTSAVASSAGGGSPLTAEGSRVVREAAVGVEKIVIAIHGIGDQYQNATIQTVVSAFGRFARYPATIPLGSFRGDASSVQAFKLKGPPAPAAPLGAIGFFEIYWADVPRAAQKEGYIIEESKAWARTVVERVRARFGKAASKLDFKGPGNQPLQLKLEEKDYLAGADAIEEMIETFRVLDNLLFIAEKAGILKFDLGNLLTQYIGDVQIVADFGNYRRNILDHFGQVLDAIYEANPAADIYVIAHSEGTVLAWMGLLEAMCSRPRPARRLKGGAMEKSPPPHPAGWVGQLRGFMTIGSPIDKHLILWPDIWDPVQTPYLGFLIDLPELIGKMKAPRDELAEFLWSQLSGAGQKSLGDQSATEEEKEKGQAALIRELGAAITKSSLYEEQRFAKVNLSDKTKRLRDEIASLSARDLTSGENREKLVRLNLRLLGDAYPPPQPEVRIKWRNYYDYGDPVGFRLDTARDWMEKHQWDSFFEFTKDDDYGFGRYLLPGAAHNDYWTDDAVFGHFIQNIIGLEPVNDSLDQPGDNPSKPAPAVSFKDPPGDKPLKRFGSYVIPYFVILGIIYFAVYLVYKGMLAQITPEKAPSIPILHLVRNVSGITMLLAGMIALARIPRLTRDPRWFRRAAALFLAGAVIYTFLVTAEVHRWHALRLFDDKHWMRTHFSEWGGDGVISAMRDYHIHSAEAASILIVVMAAAISLFAAWGSRQKWHESAHWARATLRQFFVGARPLIIPGAFWVFVVIGYRLVFPGVADATGKPLWPLILASGAFLYLWWLATLIFDLVFVWHRYIRHAVTHNYLFALRKAERSDGQTERILATPVS